MPRSLITVSPVQPPALGRRGAAPWLRAALLLGLCLPVLPLGGCVFSSKYKLKEEELAASQKREADLQTRLKAAQDRVADLEKQLAENKSALEKTTAEREALRKELDDSTALVGQLKGRLEKLGQNVEKLTAEQGQLNSSLQEAKARLEELRKAKAAAEARAAVFHKLIEQLRSMIDAGQLKVIIRDGRMLIALPDDVLFDSGKTEVKPAGQVALGKVAQVLATVQDRKFLVAGHTDNVPIRHGRFKSNWELSSARAIEVVGFLVQNGMRPEVLAAAGYSEFDPVAPNDTPQNKAQNRRIEIVLQPNLADLPSLEGLEKK